MRGLVGRNERAGSRRCGRFRVATGDAVTQALVPMKKFDLPLLEKAYRGESS